MSTRINPVGKGVFVEVEQKQGQFESHVNRWDNGAMKFEGALH